MSGTSSRIARSGISYSSSREPRAAACFGGGAVCRPRILRTVLREMNSFLAIWRTETPSISPRRRTSATRPEESIALIVATRAGAGGERHGNRQVRVGGARAASPPSPRRRRHSVKRDRRGPIPRKDRGCTESPPRPQTAQRAPGVPARSRAPAAASAPPTDGAQPSPERVAPSAGRPAPPSSGCASRSTAE